MTAKAIAIIPARAGSKGLVGKNYKTLAGKPLIAYSIEAAQAVAGLEIQMASDDPEILRMAKNDYGLACDYLRPPHLSTDEASMSDLIIDLLRWRQSKGSLPRIGITLQPTSPFRTAKDIEKGIALCESTGRGVIGVSEMMEHPYECVSVEGDKWNMLRKPPAKRTRRQDYDEEFYFITGALYCFDTEKALAKNEICHDDSELLFMPKINSIDIDDAIDFAMAEGAMLAHQRGDFKNS